MQLAPPRSVRAVLNAGLIPAFAYKERERAWQPYLSSPNFCTEVYMFLCSVYFDFFIYGDRVMRVVSGQLAKLFLPFHHVGSGVKLGHQV